MGMNPETHRFEPLDSPAALETAQAKKWKIFKTGEKVTLNGTSFTVVDIQPTKLVLRPFGLGLSGSAPVDVDKHPPHQQRVLIERAELEEKLGKLRSFFNSSTYAGLNPKEQDRLTAQEEIMDRYRAILVERIEAF
jgi:hypothetical protein